MYTHVQDLDVTYKSVVPGGWRAPQGEGRLGSSLWTTQHDAIHADAYTFKTWCNTYRHIHVYICTGPGCNVQISCAGWLEGPAGRGALGQQFMDNTTDDSPAEFRIGEGKVIREYIHMHMCVVCMYVYIYIYQYIIHVAWAAAYGQYHR
jgi:hypothetical protein